MLMPGIYFVAFVLFLDSSLLARESKEVRREQAKSVRLMLSYGSLARLRYYQAREHAKVGFDAASDYAVKTRAEFEKIAHKLTPKKRANLGQAIEDLTNALKLKITKPAAVEESWKLFFQLTTDFFLMDLSPAQTPTPAVGKAVYSARCSICHGEAGKADTAIAQKLNPSPEPVSGQSYQTVITPFMTVNHLIMGIEGTGKNSFEQTLSADEMWNAIYWMSALSVEPCSLDSESLTNLLKQMLNAGLTLKLVSTRSNSELVEWITEQKQIVTPASKVLACLRRALSFDSTVPR